MLFIKLCIVAFLGFGACALLAGLAYLVANKDWNW